MKDHRPARALDTIKDEINVLLNEESHDNFPERETMRRLTLTKLYLEMAEALNYKKPGGALAGRFKQT